MGLSRGIASTVGLLLAFGVLAACERQQEPALPEPEVATTTTAPAAAAPPPVDVNWQAIEPAVLISKGPPAELKLEAQGYMASMYLETPVAVGETWIADFTAEGPADKLLRAVLQRHCDSDKGEGMASESFVLTGAPTRFQVRKTFDEAYGCVRVMFLSQTGEPLTVKIDQLTLAKAQ